MQFRLQKETNVPGIPFTCTKFISWEDSEDVLKIFWGTEVIHEYKQLTTYKVSPQYDFLERLESAINDDIDDIYRNLDRVQRDKLTSVETNPIIAYQNLVRHLWKTSEDKIYEYVPVNSFTLLKEWHQLLMEKNLREISITSLEFLGGDIAQVKNGFILSQIDKTKREIEESNKWYKQVYNITEEAFGNYGNQATKKPINNLRQYLRWLENGAIFNGNIENNNPDNIAENPNSVEAKIDNHIKPFLDDNSVNENDYNILKKVLINYFNEEDYKPIANHIFLKTGNKKKLGFALGNLHREIKPGKIKISYLELLKVTINQYAREEFEQADYQRSNLYKYITTKPPQKKQ
jgi:hypothetical protein